MNNLNEQIPEELKRRLKRQKNIIGIICTIIGVFFGLGVIGQIISNELNILTVIFFIIFFLSGIIILLNNNFREDGYINDDDMNILSKFINIVTYSYFRNRKKKK